jgi:hypothetical protein
MIEDVIYQICCHNEWCSGPEIWNYTRERPIEPLCCPICGWIAMHGSGIKKIDLTQNKEY